jgi:hypothetical protein
VISLSPVPKKVTTIAYLGEKAHVNRVVDALGDTTYTIMYDAGPSVPFGGISTGHTSLGSALSMYGGAVRSSQ